MVNHPNRKRSGGPARPPDAPLARLLHKAERMTHDAASDLLSERERAILAALPEMIASDGMRWRLTPEGKTFARAHDDRPGAGPVDANRIYWLLRRIIAADDNEIKAACIEAGLDVSRSRISGWRKHPADRKHAKMTMDELEAVLLGLIAIGDYVADDGEEGRI